MTSRSAPLWIVLLLAVGASMFWFTRPVVEKQLPSPAPLAPSLSDLAPAPDWTTLEEFQSTISRSDFLRQMEDIFTVSPAWRGWFEVGEKEVTIRTDPGQVFRLRFAPEGQESAPPRYWRSLDQLPSAPPDRPLEGLKIVIDPGHIGGHWGKMEERWFQIPGSLPVMEGDMTLKVAELLKPQLERLGAQVDLTRILSHPVTAIRPDFLKDHVEKRGAGGDIKLLAERLFYRTAEIRARADLVNQTLKPDLVLCLHFNADAWGNPNAPTLVPANHFHMILNGGYTDDELAKADQRHDLLTKLLQGVHDEERRLSAAAAAAFVEKTAMPPYLYDPLAKNHRNVDGNPYLWARNLLANRLYHCPVVFFEPYVMNSTEDHARIQAGDYEGLREVAGKVGPSIFSEYAGCVASGLERHFRTNRKHH